MKGGVLIPFVVWGGEPIGTLRQTEGFVWVKDCLELARALVDPGLGGDRGYMNRLHAGRVWVDIPLGEAGAGERLIVRSFYRVSEGGQRNLWHHGAFRIVPGPRSAETHAGFLRRIEELTIDSLLGDEMTRGIPVVPVESADGLVTEWPRVISRPWRDALNELESLVLRTDLRQMGRTRIGCNLPERDEMYTTLVESDGYVAPRPPEAKKDPDWGPRKEPERSRLLQRRAFWLGALAVLCVLSGAIGFKIGDMRAGRARNSSLRQQNDELRRENETLRQQNDGLRRENMALRRAPSGDPGRDGGRRVGGIGPRDRGGTQGSEGDGTR